MYGEIYNAKLYSCDKEGKNWLYSDVEGFCCLLINEQSKIIYLSIFDPFTYEKLFQYELYNNFHQYFENLAPTFRSFEIDSGFMGILFESEEEAYKYAISLQINRRNLDSANLLKNVSFLLGTDFIQNYQGSKAELIGDTLGVCKRTAQRYMSVVKNASDEEKELIDDGQISSYKVYKDHHKKEGNTSLKDDDLTDSLEDDSGNPAPILIRERKKSSKSKYEEEQEKRDAKKVAENRAYIKGLVRSSVTFILGKVEEGFSSNEIEQDEEVKQLLENPFDFRFRKETNND
jgi:hypothetical protein